MELTCKVMWTRSWNKSRKPLGPGSLPSCLSSPSSPPSRFFPFSGPEARICWQTYSFHVHVPTTDPNSRGYSDWPCFLLSWSYQLWQAGKSRGAFFICSGCLLVHTSCQFIVVLETQHKNPSLKKRAVDKKIIADKVSSMKKQNRKLSSTVKSD